MEKKYEPLTLGDSLKARIFRAMRVKIFSVYKDQSLQGRLKRGILLTIYRRKDRTLWERLICGIKRSLKYYQQNNSLKARIRRAIHKKVQLR